MKLNYLSLNLLSQKTLPFPDLDTIDICIFSIENFTDLSDGMKILPVQEQKKGASFHQENDRLRYLASRILLRSILSRYLTHPANELDFQTGPHGKPFLCSDRDHLPEIHFNLSHSGKYAALAFSSASPVGIDIEAMRDTIRAEALVRRFFHADEYAEFLELDEKEQQEFVLRRWTVREAFLKGIGSGLSLDPASFYVRERSPVFCIEKSQKDYSSWRIEPIPVPGAYLCSIAYQPPV